MANFMRSLQLWSHCLDSRERPADVEIEDHTIGNDDLWIRSERFLIGNAAQMLGRDETGSTALDRFIRRSAQKVLYGAGTARHRGVDLRAVNARGPGGARGNSLTSVFEHLLRDGSTHPTMPVFAWVSPRTFSLSRRMKRSIGLELAGSRFNIARHSQALESPLPFDAPLVLNPAAIPFAEAGGMPLAMLRRQYQGAFLLRHEQNTLTPMENDAYSREFMMSTDVAPHHDGYLQMSSDGRTVLSDHPFIAVGRVRPRGIGDLYIFDYVLTVLHAESEGIVALSRLSVELWGWLSKWPAIFQGVCEAMGCPRYEHDVLWEDMLERGEFDAARSLIAEEADNWRLRLTGRPSVDATMADAFSRIWDMGRNLWGDFRSELVRGLATLADLATETDNMEMREDLAVLAKEMKYARNIEIEPEIRTD